MRNVIDLTQTKKYDDYVLSIDFYKAFDCVDHIFLKTVSKCSGFSDTFFQNSETAVVMNEFVNNFFLVKRDVRQGDPISL